ncbi:Trm112 family protein [candidate division KSB1 bacterium]|nr:Trm112 family protein [candidate division KSB1 bacterium]
MNSKNTQIACPQCRSTVALAVNGNTLETPLICQACGQTFLPHFYCPEANSSSRHIFAASRLYVDNMGAIYTFCPDHTFTTYALAADSKPRLKRTPFQAATRFFDSIVFRLSLTIEGWRWRLVTRR